MKNRLNNQPSMRSGFTMIELIFVIVIIGILASVAIPKLAATRDDAKISKMANAIQTAKSELSAKIIATNNVPNDDTDPVQSIKDYSNTIAEAVISGDATVTNIDNSSSYITFIDKDSGAECKKMYINGNKASGNVMIGLLTEDNTTSAICKGVNTLVTDTNISVGGTQVTY